MRLVHYYPRALIGDGGVTNATWAWASAMAESGCEVLVACAGDGVSRGPGDIPVAGIVDRRLRIGLPRLRKATLERGDIVVLHSGWVPDNAFVAAWLARWGFRYIVMPHGAYEPALMSRRRLLKRTWSLAERHVLEHALGVHVFFESEENQVRRIAPAARTLVAPTGFTVPPYGWEGGGGYLAWLGRYDIEHKGIDLLLNAVARIDKARRPNLVLHGRDSRHALADVQALARDLGIAPWVDVHGPLSGDDKLRFLREADGYVHPSRWESHSIALIEALSLGLPCIVSDSIHIAPNLREQGAAEVCSPGEELSEALACMASSSHVRLGARARAYVQENLSWPAVTADLLRQLAALGVAV